MKQTLLIADGDTELCDVYRKFLADRGYEVATSSDGLDCLRKLRELTPAVLVLDLELCWGGGDGVLAWLREENRSPAVSVVLTATAWSSPDVAERRAPPVVGYLPKPFGLTALLETVRAAIAKGQEGACKASFVPVSPEFFIG